MFHLCPEGWEFCWLGMPKHLLPAHRNSKDRATKRMDYVAFNQFQQIPYFQSITQFQLCYSLLKLCIVHEYLDEK